MIEEYKFKTEPFKHQLKEWTDHQNTQARAIFWEQGTGKSKLIIDTAWSLWKSGQITAVIIVAPNGVHRNWIESEIIEHTPEDCLPYCRAFCFESSKSATKASQREITKLVNHKGLSWFAISYEGFVTKRGKEAMISLFDNRRVKHVLDESHYIKNPSAVRTKSIIKSAKYSNYRRILTGTPIAAGPFDVFAPVKFLDETYWRRRGLGTYTEFKNYFGVWKQGYNKKTGRDFKYLVSYRRLDELTEMLKEISTRVLKDDVLDLPPKQYQSYEFELSTEQRTYYDQLRDDFVVWLKSGDYENEVKEIDPYALDPCGTCGGTGEIEESGYIYPCPDCSDTPIKEQDEGDIPVVASIVITRLLRLQQITCGYLPTGEEDAPIQYLSDKNPRLEALEEIIKTHDKKIIVWARFQEDITGIMNRLSQIGIKAARYDGLCSDDEKAQAKAAFQGVRPIKDGLAVVGKEEVPEDEQVQVFVGNPAVGATGLTLTAGKVVVYYSNSFKLIDRLQSEDRTHRIGQDESPLYIDLLAKNTIDEKIAENLRNKFNIACEITGDNLKEWL